MPAQQRISSTDRPSRAAQSERKWTVVRAPSRGQRRSNINNNNNNNNTDNYKQRIVEGRRCRIPQHPVGGNEICFRCGKAGHYAAECWSRTGGWGKPQAKPNTTQRASTVQTPRSGSWAGVAAGRPQATTARKEAAPWWEMRLFGEQLVACSQILRDEEEEWASLIRDAKALLDFPQSVCPWGCGAEFFSWELRSHLRGHMENARRAFLARETLARARLHAAVTAQWAEWQLSEEVATLRQAFNAGGRAAMAATVARDAAKERKSLLAAVRKQQWALGSEAQTAATQAAEAPPTAFEEVETATSAPAEITPAIAAETQPPQQQTTRGTRRTRDGDAKLSVGICAATAICGAIGGNPIALADAAALQPHVPDAPAAVLIRARAANYDAPVVARFDRGTGNEPATYIATPQLSDALLPGTDLFAAEFEGKAPLSATLWLGDTPHRIDLRSSVILEHEGHFIPGPPEDRSVLMFYTLTQTSEDAILPAEGGPQAHLAPELDARRAKGCGPPSLPYNRLEWRSALDAILLQRGVTNDWAAELASAIPGEILAGLGRDVDAGSDTELHPFFARITKHDQHIWVQSSRVHQCPFPPEALEITALFRCRRDQRRDEDEEDDGPIIANFGKYPMFEPLQLDTEPSPEPLLFSTPLAPASQHAEEPETLQPAPPPPPQRQQHPRHIPTLPYHREGWERTAATFAAEPWAANVDWRRELVTATTNEMLVGYGLGGNECHFFFAKITHTDPTGTWVLSDPDHQSIFPPVGLEIQTLYRCRRQKRGKDEEHDDDPIIAQFGGIPMYEPITTEPTDDPFLLQLTPLGPQSQDDPVPPAPPQPPAASPPKAQPPAPQPKVRKSRAEQSAMRKAAHEREREDAREAKFKKARAERQARTGPGARAKLFEAVELNSQNLLPRDIYCEHKLFREVNTRDKKALGQRLAEVISEYPVAEHGVKEEIFTAFLLFPRVFLQRGEGKKGRKETLNRLRNTATAEATATNAQPQEPAANTTTTPAQGADTTPPPAPNVPPPGDPDQDLEEHEPRESKEERNAKLRASYLASRGHFGRAARTLDRESVGDLGPRAKEILQDLHPQPEKEHFFTKAPPATIRVDPDILLTVLQRSRGAKAPGPSGWTEELLYAACSEPLVLDAIAEMVLDILNHNISDHLRELIVSSRLIALPKAGGGVRPIAIPECILKIAEAYIWKISGWTARSTLSASQQAFENNGCESIIHKARALMETGQHTLACIDARNAFNSVSRTLIWRRLLEEKALLPFRPLFTLEYGSPSALLGEVIDLKSSEGVRQGSLLGAFFFCLAIDPLLKAVQGSMANVRIFAYMDDICVLGSPEDTHQATSRIITGLHSANLDTNRQKSTVSGKECNKVAEWLGFKSQPEGSRLLGAWVEEAPGSPHAANFLAKQLDRNKAFFTRVPQLQPSLAFPILLKCGVPRWNFVTRTHAPEAQADATAAFDGMVVTAFKKIADITGNLTETQEKILHLPQHLGGLGLTRYAPLATSNYQASRSAQDPEAPDQCTLTALHNKTLLETLPEDDKIALKCYARVHASDWITSGTPSKMYSHALQSRLRWHAFPERQQVCDCGLVHAGDHADQHALGCTKVRGANASSRHAAIRDTINVFCRTRGFPSRTEPAISGGLRGDLLLTFGLSAPAYVDIVLANPLCTSHVGKQMTTIVQQKEQIKQRKYAEAVAAIGGELHVLVIETTGGFPPKSAQLIRAIERDCDAPGELFRQLAAVLMHWNGAIVSNARLPKTFLRFRG